VKAWSEPNYTRISLAVEVGSHAGETTPVLLGGRPAQVSSHMVRPAPPEGARQFGPDDRRINDMADNDLRSPVPTTARATTALLREARSLSRRADKLSATAAAMADLTTQQLTADASTRAQHLVHHLTILERQLQQHEKQAVRRGL